MNSDPHRVDPTPSGLLELYDRALPEVYRYLHRRCGSAALAEDVTSATFVSAALAVERGSVESMSIGWLMTVARNRLIDHWRHQAVVDRSQAILDMLEPTEVDPWDEVLDAERAHRVLATIEPHYRMVLTLRYLDDLTVAETADALDKSVRATESLLARARRRFRDCYQDSGGPDDRGQREAHDV